MTSDYKAHVVSEATYDKVEIGRVFSGGEVVNGMCHGGRYILLTYHGADAHPAPIRTPRVAESEANER